MRMYEYLPIGTIPNHVHRYATFVGVVRMCDYLPIGTIPNHVHRYATMTSSTAYNLKLAK
jgi:hypothetical protein